MRGEAAELELEDLTVAHASVMFEGLSDGALYDYLDEAPPLTAEHLAERYRVLERRTSPDGRERWLNWAVHLPGSSTYVGYVQATVDPGGTASIAYVVFREHWGRGYGRQAVAIMLRLLRDRYGVRKAIARIDSRNARSSGLLKSLNFQFQRAEDNRDQVFELDLEAEAPPG